MSFWGRFVYLRLKGGFLHYQKLIIMNILLVFAAAILPVAILLMYIFRKDPQPEPKSWLCKSMFYGMAIIIPVIFVELLLQLLLFGPEGKQTTIFDSTLNAFVVAALPEETFKLLALWLVLRKNPFFDEHFDGIVYAVCVGMGFAAIENIMYVVGEESWHSVAIGRALFAVPAHYAFAVLMGYYYSVYHFIDHSPLNAIKILAYPVVAHGIYDAIIMGFNVNPYLSGIGSFALIFFCIRLHKYVFKRITAMIEIDKNKNINC